jgi:hypothetical protein
MTSNETQGYLRRILTALPGALRRGILGKSSHDYMKQFTGGDDYWDRVIAAQLGWPQKEPPNPETAGLHVSGKAFVNARASVQDNGPVLTSRPPRENLP